jgi:hypothetical protein
MNEKSSQTLLSLILISLLITISILITACSCSSETQQQTEVPSSIINKSNQFIVSKTGKNIFQNYITIDPAKTKKIGSDFFMVYKFKIPDKSYVNNEIRFTVDSLGNVLQNREVVGIPDCASNPNLCKFSVTEEQARQVAADHSLSKGIKDWSADFEWNAKYNQYVWKILSTEKETKVGDRIKGNGQQMIIDPNTGDVIATNEWKIN